MNGLIHLQKQEKHSRVPEKTNRDKHLRRWSRSKEKKRDRGKDRDRDRDKKEERVAAREEKIEEE